MVDKKKANPNKAEKRLGVSHSTQTAYMHGTKKISD
jgi:hypothetical protein